MKIINTLCTLIIGFLLGAGSYKHISGKIILDEKEYMRQCEQLITVGNFICNTEISLEETKKNWCKL